MEFFLLRRLGLKASAIVVYILVIYAAVNLLSLRLFLPLQSDIERFEFNGGSGLNMSTFQETREAESQFVKSRVTYSYPENDDYVEQEARKQTEQRVMYWYNSKKGEMHCGTYIFPPDLDATHLVWQHFSSSTGLNFLICGSYYDNRVNPPEVRILANINARELTDSVKVFCQLWFYGSFEPVISNVTNFHHLFFLHIKSQPYEAYLLSCPVPEQYLARVPHSVSLVERECDLAPNNVNVIYNVPMTGDKKEFAVCVKGLLYTHNGDSATNLVEWLELLFALSVDKVYIHVYDVHPSVRKVLNYYESLRVVETRYMSDPDITVPFGKFNMTGHSANFFIGQQEVVSHQDCFYRNIHLYKYIGIFDSDEIIVPFKGDTYKELIDYLATLPAPKNVEYGSFKFRNVYFMPEMTPSNMSVEDIPPYMNIMKNVYRSLNHTPSGHFVKSFHRTDLVETLYQHSHARCIRYPCKRFEVDIQDAQLQHYRKTCSRGIGEKVCLSLYKNYTIKDANIWRYKERVVTNTIEVLNLLGIVAFSNVTL